MSIRERRKQRRERSERLNALGRELVRASAAREEEADAAASSPFLYARLRASIAAESARREEPDDWRAALALLSRAVPPAAIVAALALVLFISASFGAASSPGAGDYGEATLLGERDTAVEHVVFEDGATALTRDEVLATIVEDEREAQR
jgi:hypothetical protein